MSADQYQEYRCLKCGEPVAVGYESQLTAASRMSFSLTVQPGEYLTATTVGASIQEMAKMLIACGRELGAETNVAVEAISTKDGTIKVDLLLTRHKPELETVTESASQHDVSGGTK